MYHSSPTYSTKPLGHEANFRYIKFVMCTHVIMADFYLLTSRPNRPTRNMYIPHPALYTVLYLFNFGALAGSRQNKHCSRLISSFSMHVALPLPPGPG
jgi:hypothetical protein